jgi:ribosomal protein L11 methyltransferase
MTEPRYPFVAVDVATEISDEVGVELFELGALGVEERDDATLSRGPGAGRVTVVGSFEDRAAADEAIAALRASHPDGDARLEEVVGDAWRDAWKEHFSPFALTPHVTVAPPWAASPEPATPDAHVLVLEPGRAFGTGLHATTALVSEILDGRTRAVAGREVLDVGCGSGILSFVALLLGATRAIAIDTDEDVIEIVRENAERNGLADRVEARAGGIETITGTYPVVLANIEARVLRPIAEDLARAVAPGGLLVLSGILAGEHAELQALYERVCGRRLHHLESRRRQGSGAAGSVDDWVAIAFAAAP